LEGFLLQGTEKLSKKIYYQESAISHRIYYQDIGISHRSHNKKMIVLQEYLEICAVLCSSLHINF
jgi:hypothetical protein